jgi:hypothetical protein
MVQAVHDGFAVIIKVPTDGKPLAVRASDLSWHQIAETLLAAAEADTLTVGAIPRLAKRSQDVFDIGIHVVSFF